ncbi:MAG: tRNA (adenosine(37)-N6)-threonylcarbamoyltransferase complex ATPase subunit type 1 TsaE [Verrucomicrobiales bacterium]|nr:tRNA (adenosine(37)-N6)-threonylcarbamoyltransferase complex ATPase subunit type 1 TsaE [Verrucomicrobiales bacterium]
MDALTPTLLAGELDTIGAGERMAGSLRAGDVLALTGGLGAGKTHLTKGIVAGLGSSAEVSSPTFTLVHEYAGGRLPVFHFDFYRLESAFELLALGWDEHLESGGVCVVEWADKFPRFLPAHAQWWRLAALPDGGRSLHRLQAPPEACDG